MDLVNSGSIVVSNIPHLGKILTAGETECGIYGNLLLLLFWNYSETILEKFI